MSLDTPTTEPTPVAASPVVDPRVVGRAGWAGAAAAGLALGLAELAAGVFESIPSAVAAVGSFVVDWSPSFVKRFAIEVFGTADKGALAVGTTIIALVIGLGLNFINFWFSSSLVLKAHKARILEPGEDGLEMTDA